MLGGCQSAPSDDQPLDVGDFVAQGKMALRAPDSSISARFRWRQLGELYDLELWGAFGQGRTRLRGDAETMALLDGQGAVLEEGSPASIMRREIGWELPMGSMLHWARGTPDRSLGSKGVKRDRKGRIVRFEQLGWQIVYGEFHANNLPRTMRLETGEYMAKLVFGQWQLGLPLSSR